MTPSQLGALISHFDGDGDGTIDGTEFKLEFCKISEAAKKAMKLANEQQGEGWSEAKARARGNRLWRGLPRGLRLILGYRIGN